VIRGSGATCTRTFRAARVRIPARGRAYRAAGKCREALAIANAPVDPKARLTFADDELRAIEASTRIGGAFDEIRDACRR
jgi:hypothetical protein